MNGLIKGCEVRFDKEYIHVKLEDDRVISTPLKWYKPLLNATQEELLDYKFICMNSGIEWESLDYHLSIEGMLQTSKIEAA